jgi:predicted dinucleotide-binding enzyme
MIGTRDKTKLAGWHCENPRALIGSFRESATSGEVVVLAVKGLAAADALRAAGSDELSRKPLIDATDPVADAPPTHGVLKFFTSSDESLMERL